jgi:ABC-type oligopeptide transport system substrate-binding subunit
VSGIHVIDSLTLQIRARWPVPYFLTELAYPTSFALDRKSIEKYGPPDDTAWYSNPVASGPYRLRSWSPNNKMVLARNRYYAGAPPAVRQITIALGPLPTSDVYSYVSQNLDVVDLPIIDRSIVNRPGMIETQALSIDGVYFDMKRKPFNDPRVRRALTLATPRVQVVTESLGASATPFGGYVPEGEWGYDPRLSLFPYDPRRARASLKAAGYSTAKDFPRVTLYYVDDPAQAELALLLAASWRKVLRVNVQTRAVQVNTMFADVQSNALPLYLFGWSADYPDPHDWLALQWRSDATNNEVHYRSRRLDRLVETADVTWMWARRDYLYNLSQQVLVDAAAWIPLYTPHRLVYVRPGIQNLYVTGYGVIPRAGDWTNVQFHPARTALRGAF